MSDSRFLTTVVEFAATYAVHSTVFLSLAWLIHRQIASFYVREKLWKTAAVGPLLSAAVQLTLLPTLTWQLELSALIERGEPQIEITDVVPREDEPGPVSAESSVEKIAVAFDAEEPSNPVASEWVSDVQDGEWKIEITPAPLRSPPLLEADEKSPAIAVAERRAPVGVLWSADETAESPSTEVDRDLPTSVRLCSAFVMTFWGLGCVRLLWTVGRLSWLLRRKEDGSQRTTQLLKRILKQRGIRRRVRLVESSAVSEPCACGVFRWCVVLPEALADSLSSEELTVLLSHELGHLVRGDTLWQWIGRLLTCLFGWQPMNFLAVRCWQQASEFQCDDWAVRERSTRIVLAGVLATVAERKAKRVWSPGVPAVAPPLSQRIERLLDDDRKKDGWVTGPLRRFLLVALSVPPLLAIAFMPKFVWAQAKFSSDDSPPDTVLQEDQVSDDAANDSIVWREMRSDFGAMQTDLQLALELLDTEEADNAIQKKAAEISQRLNRLKRLINE